LTIPNLKTKNFTTKKIKMKTTKIFVLLTVLLSISALWSCKKEGATEPQHSEEQTAASGKKPVDPGFAENNMVMYWNEKTSLVLGAPNPPSQARFFAIIQIAVHDALNSIKPKFERYALLNERNQFASPDAAVASAAYWAIKGLNRQGNFPVDTWYNESLATIPDGESKELGKTLGKLAADAIIAKRSTDNYVQANQVLALPDGINSGEYRSTLPFSNPGMAKTKSLPFWGTLMTPFVVQRNDQFRPAAPYPVNSVQYEMEYNEVKTKGALVGHTRTAEESEIGTFWIERPSAAWNRFVRNMIADKKMDAWKTARLFALLHTAMMDGVTSGFEAAYYHFYWRPETAIRMTDNGNPNTTSDPTWLPSFTEGPNLANPALNAYSPPLPAYPNVQANFGGAAAEVLKLFFGSDIISVDQTSPVTPGVTRHYSTISGAARDNSIARLYAGHNFRSGCLAGEEQGKQIGHYVFNHSFRESGD